MGEFDDWDLGDVSPPRPLLSFLDGWGRGGRWLYRRYNSLVWLFKYRLPYHWRQFRNKVDLIRIVGLFTCLRLWLEFRKRYRRLHEAFGDRVKKGRLLAFAETGTEGFCWKVYEDGKSGYAGDVSVEGGDWLTIFFHDGSVAFDSVIDPDWQIGRRPYPLNPEYGQPCAFGCWIHWTQRDWSVEEWAALFFHGTLVGDGHPLLSRATDKVPFRAIVVKSERPDLDQLDSEDDN